MPLLCARPQRVSAGERVVVDSTIDLGERIDVPVNYDLSVEFSGSARG